MSPRSIPPHFSVKRIAIPSIPVARPATPNAEGFPHFVGVGKPTLDRLHKLGLHTRFDLVLHLPLRYEDETHITLIRDARAGDTVQVEATLTDARIQYRPKRQLVCQVEDPSGSLVIRFLYFYPGQVKTLVPDRKLRLMGEVRSGFFGPEMIHPKYRVLHGLCPLPEALTPVYPTTAGLSQQNLSKLIAWALENCDLTDTLPHALRTSLDLAELDQSLRCLHHPPPDASRTQLQDRNHWAWRRLKFDELLAQQLSLRQYRARQSKAQAPALKSRGAYSGRLLRSLPFALTAAQRRVADEINADLRRTQPMNRLLQGDVGSGKTIVAVLAALQAIESGYQAAVMAPTEILAEQNYFKFAGWLTPLGLNVVWLASRMPATRRKAIVETIARGEVHVAIGTHALIQDQVVFQKLALAIIDEQHRFGVQQRLAMRRKAVHPHQLMMSATPIPRTLAMSYYADLEVSIIDELPPGRAPVITRLVMEQRRDEVITRVRDVCRSGKQVYWVCPLVEESETLQLQTAVDTHATLTLTFPELAVGLLHGRLPNEGKTQVMQAFQRHETQLLVATTVIEVGVDVSNASLMVIENAERLGLSQLHQLRGRVGRGTAHSTCILLYKEPLSDAAKARLKTIYETTDGFEIARQDLIQRGPGEFIGARQSGIPLLRVADVVHDVDLLESARQTAPLMEKQHPEQVEPHIQRWLGSAQDYLAV
ncbi:MAG: ATP-dependent DNA helicase RecG [Burkholderiales bacterium]